MLRATCATAPTGDGPFRVGTGLSDFFRSGGGVLVHGWDAAVAAAGSPESTGLGTQWGEPPSPSSLDMLDLAFGLTDTSRLGCQIKLTKELEGIRATIPGGADNMLPPKG